jgi:alkylhydroperoxidase/carboxymuconolactone decarboxylase family protein YurZ
MDQNARFQEILRRVAIFDERLVGPGSGFGLPEISALDAKITALLRVAAAVTIGSSAVCLEWSVGRALAAGGMKDEIAEVLLAIAPIAGLARVVSAAPGLAAGLEYDLEAALEDPDSY